MPLNHTLFPALIVCLGIAGAPPAAVAQVAGSDPISFYNAVSLYTPEYAFSLSAVSDTSVWYTTNRGLYRFNGVAAEKMLDASLFATNLVEVFLVEALSDHDVWVVGHDARTWLKSMYHYDGRRWALIPLPPSGGTSGEELVLFRFRIARDSLGYYGVGVGEDGLYYTFDGTKWERKPSFSTRTLRALEMLSRDDIWAGGRDGVLFHFDGNSWSPMRVQGEDFTDYILDMSFSSSVRGWAVSTNHSLSFSEGAWTLEQLPEGSVPRTVKALANGDAWIFTDNGTVLRRDGPSWGTVAKVPMQTGYASVGVAYTEGASAAGGLERNYSLYVVTSTGILSNVWGRLPTFIDISPAVNIHLNGGQVESADFDGNGSEDLFVCADGKYPDRLYANRGDGFFTEMTDRLHPPGRSIASRATIADLDNNGFPDILAHRGLTDNFWYKNSGSWNFNELDGPVSRQASSNYSRIRAADMDNDGDLDLVLMPAADERSSESLVVYNNDGVGNFPDSTVVEFTRKTGSSPISFFLADLDGDRRTDIFKYNIRDRSEFYHNAANGIFREMAHERGLDWPASPASPVPPSITWAHPIDINNDGALDVFIVSREGLAAFLMNDGSGGFSPGESLRFDPGGDNPVGSFSDIDCDGDEDLFLHDRFYENRGGKFTEFRYLGFRRVGGAKFLDIDGDGDEDIVFTTLKNEQSLIVYENGVNPANVVTVRLRGIGSNSGGVGSSVRLWKSGSPGVRTPERVAFVESAGPLRFAIDTSCAYELEVRFPSGLVVTRTGVRPGALEIPEYGPVEGWAVDFYHSVRRSITMARPGAEALKLAGVVVLLIGSLFYATRRLTTSAKGNLAFGIGILPAYLLALHGTIRWGAAASTLIPIGGVCLVTGVWIGVGSAIERRRRARRISHYLLGTQLGEGGMGKVFAATDTVTGETVAIKLLNQGLLSDPENRKRLIAEGHLLSTLRHPNIVDVHEVGEHLGQAFIAMEHLPGGTLRQRCEAGIPLPLADVKRIALEILAGLGEIHGRGVIHRDLKSGNIMFGGDGGVRIMDFGLSKSPLVTTMTTLGTILGTLGYVSPEQVTNISVDRRSDLFSFGVLLFEMLTGRLPFSGENEMAVIHSIFNVEPPAPSRINPAVPAQLDAVVGRCLRKNPDERYATSAELRFDLDAEYW